MFNRVLTRRPLWPRVFFLLQLIHEIDDVEPAHTVPLIDGSVSESQCQVGFSGPGTPDEDDVVGTIQIAAFGKPL
jgi:hypothetical protein